MEIPKLTKIILASLQGSPGDWAAGPSRPAAQAVGCLSPDMAEALGGDAGQDLPGSGLDVDSVYPLPAAALDQWVGNTPAQAIHAAGQHRTDQVAGYLALVFSTRRP